MCWCLSRCDKQTHLHTWEFCLTCEPEQKRSVQPCWGRSCEGCPGGWCLADKTEGKVRQTSVRKTPLCSVYSPENLIYHRLRAVRSSYNGLWCSVSVSTIHCFWWCEYSNQTRIKTTTLRPLWRGGHGPITHELWCGSFVVWMWYNLNPTLVQRILHVVGVNQPQYPQCCALWPLLLVAYCMIIIIVCAPSVLPSPS